MEYGVRGSMYIHALEIRIKFNSILPMWGSALIGQAQNPRHVDSWIDLPPNEGALNDWVTFLSKSSKLPLILRQIRLSPPSGLLGSGAFRSSLIMRPRVSQIPSPSGYTRNDSLDYGGKRTLEGVWQKRKQHDKNQNMSVKTFTQYPAKLNCRPTARHAACSM